MRLLVTLLLLAMVSMDGSSRVARQDSQPSSIRGSAAAGFPGEDSAGAGVLSKEPSPFHFPPRPFKTSDATFPRPTGLNNGRDLLLPGNGGAANIPGRNIPGTALSFGSSGGAVGGARDGSGGSGSNGRTPDTLLNNGVTSESSLAGGGGEGQAAGRRFRTRAAPSCNNASLALPCEADAEYTNEIAERIRQLIFASSLNDVIEDPTLRQILNDTAVVEPGKDFGIPSTRSGFVVESPACRAQESIIYPQRAKTATDDWVFVVNQESVKQGVRVEKCLREGEQCHLGADLPPTIRTTCRQKFIYRKLLVLGEAGTSIQPESVLLPSCCVCYIRRGRRRPEDHPLSKVLTSSSRRQKPRTKAARRRNGRP